MVKGYPVPDGFMGWLKAKVDISYSQRKLIILNMYY